MTIVQRFYLNEHDRVIDKLGTIDNAEVVWCENKAPKDETCLRECVLGSRLSRLVSGLVVDTAPTKKLFNTKDGQALTSERYSLWSTLFRAIGASHLHTIDIALSPPHVCGRTQAREGRVAGVHLPVAIRR